MDLINFVKLLPKHMLVKIRYQHDVLDLDFKLLAEHQHDTVTGIDAVGINEKEIYFVITVTPAQTVTVPNPFYSSCQCHS